MDEFELIDRYFRRDLTDSNVRVGIGDDGAVMRPEAGRDLIAVIDTLVEGVHYPAKLGAMDIAYRAVAVNLSDIAAMAGRPRWMTLALTLREVDNDWLEGFSIGLMAAAAEHNVSLVGGDTTRGQQTVISVQVTGDVHPDSILTRSGASSGDLICISGTVGDAAAGLELIQSESVSSVDAQVLAGRFCRPTARIALAQEIAAFATAAIDVSDGLYADIQKLLQASGSGGRIEIDSLPLSAAMRAEFSSERAIQFALGGGDDYELCFTCPIEKESLLDDIARQQNVKISRIGLVTVGGDLTCTEHGTVVDYRDKGFRHFGDTLD